MLVKEVMNTNVITVEPETSVKEAISTMNDNHIGSVIVVKNGKILGIMTETDVLKILTTDASMDIDRLKVADLMTHWIITVNQDDDIEKAIDLMEKHNIKKLPVVKNERLVGIVTATDIATVQPKLIEKLANLLSIKFR